MIRISKKANIKKNRQKKILSPKTKASRITEKNLQNRKVFKEIVNIRNTPKFKNIDFC